MDSLTQGLLGAVTFAIIKDRDIGKKSVLIGGVAGTIPDLDVFFSPFYHEVAFITVHRSFTHSILFAVVIGILCGELFHRLYRRQHTRWSWNIAFFLAFITHALLDCCTTYGTQILYPFSDILISWNNIHVIDPAYSIILMVCVIGLLIKSRNGSGRQRLINISLGLSMVYLGWTVVSKSIATSEFKTALHAQGIAYEKMMVSPTPFNSLLWNGIIKTENGYYIGSYSLLDRRKEIPFYYEESDNEILPQITSQPLINNYLYYTQGFPLIRKNTDGIVRIFAIKYGPFNFIGAPNFFFPLTFKIDRLTEDEIFIDKARNFGSMADGFRQLIQRIKGL